MYYYTKLKIIKLLKRLRQDRKLTQSQVAISLGITKAYISQIEAGKVGIPRHRFMIRLLEVYSIKPKYFEALLKDKNESI